MTLLPGQHSDHELMLGARVAAPARLRPGWELVWLHTFDSQLAFPKPVLIHTPQTERMCVGNASSPAGEQTLPGCARPEGTPRPGGPSVREAGPSSVGKKSKNPLKIGQSCTLHVSWMAEVRFHPQARCRQLRKGAKPSGKKENPDSWCGNQKMMPGRLRAARGWQSQQESGRARATHGEVGDPTQNVWQRCIWYIWCVLELSGCGTGVWSAAVPGVAWPGGSGRTECGHCGQWSSCGTKAARRQHKKSCQEFQPQIYVQIRGLLVWELLSCPNMPMVEGWSLGRCVGTSPAPLGLSPRFYSEFILFSFILLHIVCCPMGVFSYKSDLSILKSATKLESGSAEQVAFRLLYWFVSPPAFLY